MLDTLQDKYPGFSIQVNKFFFLKKQQSRGSALRKKIIDNHDKKQYAIKSLVKAWIYDCFWWEYLEEKDLVCVMGMQSEWVRAFEDSGGS